MATKSKTYPLHRLIPYKNVEKMKLLLNTYDMNDKNAEGKPVLILAADNDNNDEMLELLFNQSNMNPEVNDNEENRVLHYLALRGKLTFIEKLCEKFPKTTVDPENVHGETPLIMAAKMNRSDVITYLHKKGADINKTNKKGVSALYCAASNGYKETTRTLVRLGAHLSNEDVSTPLIDWGFEDINDIFLSREPYPLHEAVCCGNIKKLKKMLEAGNFDVDEKNDAGKTILHLAMEQADNDEMLHLLLFSEIGIDISVTDNENNTILHSLALRGHLKYIKEMFERMPEIKVDPENVHRETPLMMAAKTNNTNIIEYLAEKGADINKKNIQGSTALHIAAKNGYSESVISLFNLGAQLSVQDNYGCTPLNLSTHWGFHDVTEILRSKDIYPLHSAVAFQNVRILKRMLETDSFDLNQKNADGKPVLIIAAEKEVNDEILELLLDQQRIDPELGDNDRYTILHLLAMHGKFKLLEKAFQKFPNIDVNIENVSKETPLIAAAKTNQECIIRYLHSRGAKLDHANTKGFTALHYAANDGGLQSAKALVELGANFKLKDAYGCTPLMLSAHWGFYEVTEFLINVAKGTKTYISATNNNGECALWKAILRQKTDVVKLLLDHGASVNMGGAKSPLSRACNEGNVEIVRLLVEKGADVNHPGEYSEALFTCVRKKHYECAEYLMTLGVNVNGNCKNATIYSIADAKMCKILRRQDG